MYWVEVTADFLHQFNRSAGNGIYKRDIMQFLKGERFLCYGRGAEVFTDPFTKEVVTKEFYIIKPRDYGEQHVRPEKFKEIPLSAEEFTLGKVLYDD